MMAGSTLSMPMLSGASEKGSDSKQSEQTDDAALFAGMIQQLAESGQETATAPALTGTLTMNTEAGETDEAPSEIESEAGGAKTWKAPESKGGHPSAERRGTPAAAASVSEGRTADSSCEAGVSKAWKAPESTGENPSVERRETPAAAASVSEGRTADSSCEAGVSKAWKAPESTGENPSVERRETPAAAASVSEGRTADSSCEAGVSKAWKAPESTGENPSVERRETPAAVASVSEGRTADALGETGVSKAWKAPESTGENPSEERRVAPVVEAPAGERVSSEADKPAGPAVETGPQEKAAVEAPDYSGAVPELKVSELMFANAGLLRPGVVRAEFRRSDGAARHEVNMAVSSPGSSERAARSASMPVPEVRASASGASMEAKVETVQSLVETLDRRILSMVQEGTQSMRLSIRPEGLGQLTLLCREENAQLQIQIQTTSPAIQQLLQRQEGAVRALLQENGSSVGKFDVTSDGGRDEAFSRRHQADTGADEGGVWGWGTGSGTGPASQEAVQQETPERAVRTAGRISVFA